MRNQIRKAFVFIGLSFALSALAASAARASCLSDAELPNHNAWLSGQQREYAKAFDYENAAIVALDACPRAMKTQIAVRKRRAEFEMYSGDYASAAGHHETARSRWTSALSAFTIMRSGGSLKGQNLDEVLDDVREVKWELGGHWPYVGPL